MPPDLNARFGEPEDLARRLALLEEENLRLRLKLRAIETSRSWRLSAPLRAAAAILRRHGVFPRMYRALPGATLDEYQWGSASTFEGLPRIAVVAHVYYLDLADEIAKAVSRCGTTEKTVVTYVDSGGLRILQDVFRRNGLDQVDFVLVENRGRDFLPFLTVLRSGLLNEADFVLKVHTKKSLHLEPTDGQMWRQSLISGLTPGPTQIKHLVTLMSQRPEIAWACPTLWIAGNESWGRNKQQVRKLLQRLSLGLPRRLIFPAGSMFWMSRDVLTALLDLKLESWDFVNDDSLDGALGHALERFIGAWTISTGRSALGILTESNNRSC